MAFNGLGTFNRLYNWVTDKANSIKIRADRMDAEMDGMATGLSTCITKDGQTTITANLPMAGFRHTGVGNASARNHYAAAGQIQDQSLIWCGTSGGTANAQTITPSPVITAYAAGQKFSFLPVATNTSGTVTIANSGLAARNVKKGIGGAKVVLAVGDIVIGVSAEVLDDGTDYILLNPQTYSHGADIASASTVNLDTATGDYVYITGTTGITAITLSEGREATTKFSDILTITNGASLIAPGATNYTTAAGDIITWRGEASGVVRAVGGLRSSGSSFAASFSDSAFSVFDNGDSTKKIAFECSGITTATTRTATWPDKNGTVAMTSDIVNPVKAWVNFNGTGTIAIRASSNVSSITDNGTGDYTINFTSALADANYVAIPIISGLYGSYSYGNPGPFVTGTSEQAPTNSAFRIRCLDAGGATYDPKYVMISVIGN